MKYLLLLPLLLMGCNSDIRHTRETDMSFAIGDNVSVVKGPYRKCEGFISGVSNYVDADRPDPKYSLSDVSCQGKKIGNLYNANENEMKLIE